MFALACVVAVLQVGSPYSLPIGRSGSTTVMPGRLTSLQSGTYASPDDVALAATGKRFVFLGEQHATTPHQAMQAEIIGALLRSKRDVVIGVEMFQRPKQPLLDRWSKGNVTEEEFLTQSDWKGQWGFDYSFYRPIFDVVRRHKLPLLGLNVPRDWVRSVGRGGLQALTPEQRKELPYDLELQNAKHRQVFESLMGGHPVPAASLDNMYSAQVLWDEGMADTIARYITAKKPGPKTVFVVIAGAGHLMYGQGINYRLAKRGQGDGPTVVMLDSKEPISVANGLGDFVYVTPKQ